MLCQEEIQKKTGYIVMRAEGIYDVDANTSIDQLSEDLNIRMPEVYPFAQLQLASWYVGACFLHHKILCERNCADAKVFIVLLPLKNTIVLVLQSPF